MKFAVVPSKDRSDYTRGFMVTTISRSFLAVWHFGDGDTLIYGRYKTERGALTELQRTWKMNGSKQDDIARKKLTLVQMIFG